MLFLSSTHTSIFPSFKARYIRQRNVVLLTSMIIVSAITLYLFEPSSSSIYPPSPFRALTGLYCPGCGTLRGLHQLLHGNFRAALGFNPLMLLSLPYLIYSYVRYSLPAFTNYKVRPLFIQPNWIWWIVKITLAYWILRNIPFVPFSFLAP